MESMSGLVIDNIFPVTVTLAALLLFLAGQSIYMSRKLNKLQRKYELFTRGGDVNIDAALTSSLQDIALLQSELSMLKGKHRDLLSQVQGCLQNVKISRYDAFDAMGGELSYSVLLTDAKKNGIILTSIYGRDTNRCYVKNIQEGRSSRALADEEKELLDIK